MRRAIFVKFIQVIAAALLLSSAVFYLAASSALLKNSRKDMQYTLKALDSILNYSGDLKAEADQLEAAVRENKSRFTIIKSDGSVAADTGIPDTTVMDNHLEREEVTGALRDGSGYARRYSHTLERNMLYVAVRSERSGYILRMAVPYTGMAEYLVMLLPALWLGFLVALLWSAFSADHFSLSITRPLKEISQEMAKVQGDYTALSFEACRYPEINIIAETTTKMSENVRDYLDQIEQEKQIRQEFFSNASHELKTPITSIQGYAELLENDLVRDENQRKDFIRRIKKEAIHMTNLINDILMISRLESKEAEIVKSDVSMEAVAKEVLESLKPLAASHEVFIHTAISPVQIQADVRQMEELLGNLVSNAIKYNQPGGEVWVTVGNEEKSLVIRVKDNGMGIPKESVNRIFERFYRVDKGRSRRQGGTGLGLAIVKHIVNFYGGTITVESEPGVGTEFTVNIPI